MLFVLLFKDILVKTEHTRCFLPIVEIKVNNVMIDGRKLFISQLKTHEHMIILKKLQLVNEIVTQLVVCCIRLILKILRYDCNRFK